MFSNAYREMNGVSLNCLYVSTKTFFVDQLEAEEHEVILVLLVIALAHAPPALQSQ
jgi:hypothetical protein